MALLEAMAYGMAVVATDVGGIGEVVRPGTDGLLVPGDEAPALAAALLRLAEDSELRHGLGREARERAKWLDAGEVAGRLAAVYASLG